MKLNFKTPNNIEFQEICSLITEYELDNRCLQKKEFTAVFDNKKLVGFGRIRKHSDCFELCSVGIVKPYRNKGVGKALINYIVHQQTSPIYVVCIIPHYFELSGFNFCENYPNSIKDKLNYCTRELIVQEKYVAMIHVSH